MLSVPLLNDKPRTVRHRSSRRPALLGTAIALIMAVAACSSSGSSTTASSGSGSGGQCSNIPAGPIKIDNILPLSGPTASSGELEETYSILTVDYFNAHDSVCGHKFQLTDYNDKGDPATSLSLARQVVSSGVTLMLQDSYSSPQNQIQPYLMQQHVVVMANNGAYALLNPANNPTFFSYGPSNKQYAQMMVNYVKAHGYNDVGIISDGTSFSVELAADAEADAKAAGLTFIKTITYSPTAIDLTTPLTQAKLAGIKTLLPTGFTGIPAMVSGIKQIGWSPHIVGWGGLWDFGVTASQLPPGAVDGCDFSYTPGQPTSTLLTPTVTSLLNAAKAKVGINPATSGVVLDYNGLLALKQAIVAANSLDGQKIAAAIENIKNLAGVIPGFNFTFSSTDHTGYPTSGLKECVLKPGPYDILTAAS
jgi:ABC-type branched-subunit amino acid transport system substrate-binding protein